MLPHRTSDCALYRYYIKMAQTMVGSGVLPPEYEQVYRELLENCPHKDIEVSSVYQLCKRQYTSVNDIFSFVL